MASILPALLLAAGCSALALQHGRSPHTLDEIGTSLGAAHGSIGGRSGGGMAGEIFGQETVLGAHAGGGLRAGLMYDTVDLPAGDNAPKQAGTYYGWYVMPVGYFALVPKNIYVRAGIGWIFSGHVKLEDPAMNRSEGAMGVRAMVGLHMRLAGTEGFSYRLFLDGMATTTRDTTIGGYSGLALVGGMLVTFRPGR